MCRRAPSCTQMLGFLGADVIKLEDVWGGDSTRKDLRHSEDSDSFYFLIFNNNKRAVSINLKTEKGRELFTGLLKWADVLVENFSLGMLDRLGFDWDTMHEINPGLVYAAIKGFGTYGPYKQYKGWEMVAQAVGGAMATTGYPRTGRRSICRRAWAIRAAGCTPQSAYSRRFASATSPARGSAWKSPCRTPL